MELRLLFNLLWTNATLGLHQSYRKLPRKVSFQNVCNHVWIREQVGGKGGEVGKGSNYLDLEAEDCGARPGSVGEDAPQDGAGQEHPFRSDNLEKRGERKERKCFCFLSCIAAIFWLKGPDERWKVGSQLAQTACEPQKRNECGLV